MVALPGATDAAWPVAGALYGRFGLLPLKLSDEEARVLSGEPPLATATDRVRALARLRDECGNEATRRPALEALTRETGARGAVLVGAASGLTVTRTFSGATGTLGDALALPTEHLDIDKIARDAEARTKPKTQLPAALKSPWVWVAAGAAVVLGTVVYLSTRGDEAPTTFPLRLRTDR